MNFGDKPQSIVRLKIHSHHTTNLRSARLKTIDVNHVSELNLAVIGSKQRTSEPGFLLYYENYCSVLFFNFSYLAKTLNVQVFALKMNKYSINS